MRRRKPKALLGERKPSEKSRSFQIAEHPVAPIKKGVLVAQGDNSSFPREELQQLNRKSSRAFERGSCWFERSSLEGQFSYLRSAQQSVVATEIESAQTEVLLLDEEVRATSAARTRQSIVERRTRQEAPVNIWSTRMRDPLAICKLSLNLARINNP